MRSVPNYRRTMRACYLGGITQAATANFAPLLFLTFRQSYGLTLRETTLLVTLNFLTQLLVDFLTTRYADRVGYRFCIVTAHICAAAGLVGLAVMPEWFPTPLSGLLTAVVIYAIGSGIIEVLTSPIAEACPTDNKEAAMSRLHSCFSWGCVMVIGGSTALFTLFGIENWKWVTCFWALIPAFNVFMFASAPIAKIVEQGQEMKPRELLRSRIFWVLMVIILCAGAAECAVSQWASVFAEQGLRVSKTVGDLAGPCLFAVLMGTARLLQTRIVRRVRLEICMTVSAAMCIVSYGLITLPTLPAINLLGCGLCGFFVAILWPGALSLAAKRLPRGGTAMFGLLALGGDAGCSIAPTVVGFAAAMFNDELKIGILLAAVFPVILLCGILFLRRPDRVTV